MSAHQLSDAVFAAGMSIGFQIRVNPRTLGLEVVTVGEDGVTEGDLLVHDETNIALAFALARMPFPHYPVALGVLYRNPRETYDGMLARQQRQALERKGQGDLQALLRSGETWTV